MANKQRPKFSPKSNLAYEVEFMYGSPLENDHEEYGKSYGYGVVLRKAERDDDLEIGVEHVWWTIPFVNDLLMSDIGIKKGTTVSVVRTEGSGNKKYWDVTYVSGPTISKEVDAAKAKQEEAPQETAAPEEEPKDTTTSQNNGRTPVPSITRPQEMTVRLDVAYRIVLAVHRKHFAEHLDRREVGLDTRTIFIALQNGYKPDINDWNRIKAEIEEGGDPSHRLIEGIDTIFAEIGEIKTTIEGIKATAENHIFHDSVPDK